MKKLMFVFIAFLMFFNIKVMAVEQDISKTYKFEKDTTMNGVFGSEVTFFEVDNYWNIKKCYLNLVFTQSELINKNYSTLTILVNNVPVYSTNLGEKQGYKNVLKVEIPKDKLNVGANELKIKTYRRISEKPCTDEYNEGNWLVIHNESYINLDFEEKLSSNIIKEMPFPYIKLSDNKPISSMILFPDKFDNSEITAAMIIASYFGLERSAENININVSKFSEGEDKNNTDIIFLGKKDNSPKEILALLNEEQLKSCEESAIIKKANSPYNANKKILVVISNKDDMLIKASKMLLNKTLVRQINSDSIIIDKSVNVEDKTIDKGDTIAFSDMGYGGVLLEGMFKQQTSYVVGISKNKVVKDNSKIVIKTRYSKNLDFDKSLLTIYINDIPIGSKKLDSASADNDTLEVKIPEDLRNASYYNIKVAFDLKLKDTYCTVREEDNPWAYVSEQSYLYIPYGNDKSVVFENYSNPFIEKGRFNNLTVVIPDNPSNSDIKHIANIIGFLGHDIKNNAGKLNIIKGGEFSSKNHNDNLIILGTPTSNKLVQSINKYAYIKFDDSFTGFSSNDKIEILKDFSNAFSTIQLIESPYNKKNSILIVNSPNEKYLGNAVRYITDLGLNAKLRGDAVLVDSSGLIKYDYFSNKNVSETKKTSLMKNFSLSDDIKYLLIFLGVVLIFITIVAIIFIKKYKKNN